MKKKVIISVILLLVAVLAFVGWRVTTSQTKNQGDTQVFALKKGDLLDSVLVSGTVVSNKSESVYSQLSNYPIKKVVVNVGDKVKKGDVLAKLDIESLKLDVKQSELSLANAQASLENEENNKNYNIKMQTSSIESAKLDLKKAQESYDEVNKLYKSKQASKEQVSEAKSALKKTKIAYDNAKDALNNTKSQKTTAAKNNIKIQKTALEKQKKTLKDATIVAPISGTVTMVNAKDNGTATGLLFVVEDTKNLIVSTAIGEYDIALVKQGQEVIVKADSTGDKQFMGEVKEIAPTAMKDVSGNTDTTSNIQFATDIALKDKDSNIKIGMNVRLTIKLDEKKDVYSVPYDALVKEADESQWIYVVNIDENNKSANTIKKIKVETGIETDMYIEISSSELEDGMSVSLDPQNANK